MNGIQNIDVLRRGSSSFCDLHLFYCYNCLRYWLFVIGQLVSRVAIKTLYAGKIGPKS